VLGAVNLANAVVRLGKFLGYRVTVVDARRIFANQERFPEADEVVFQMGRAHQNAGRAKDAAELYKRYLTRAKNLDHRAQGLVLLAQAEIKIADVKVG